MSLSVDAIRESDEVKAERVVALKAEIVGDADRRGSHLAARLGLHEKDVAVYRFESEAMTRSSSVRRR